MTVWFIEYAATPTNFNPNVTIEHYGPIEDAVVLRAKSNAPHLKNQSSQSHVIYKIWTGSDACRDVHYQERGYGMPHISRQLRDAIAAPEIEERLIT